MEFATSIVLLSRILQLEKFQLEINPFECCAFYRFCRNLSSLDGISHRLSRMKNRMLLPILIKIYFYLFERQPYQFIDEWRSTHIKRMRFILNSICNKYITTIGCCALLCSASLCCALCSMHLVQIYGICSPKRFSNKKRASNRINKWVKYAWSASLLHVMSFTVNVVNIRKREMRNLSQTPQGGSFYGIHDDIFNFSFSNNILFLFTF